VYAGTGAQTSDYLYKDGTDGSIPGVTDYTICMWMNLPTDEGKHNTRTILSYANTGTAGQ